MVDCNFNSFPVLSAYCLTAFGLHCRAVMEKCGDADECISTSEAMDLAASLDEKIINDLPLPGQVDFINGGPPCQVCEILAFFIPTQCPSIGGFYKGRWSFFAGFLRNE